MLKNTHQINEIHLNVKASSPFSVSDRLKEDNSSFEFDKSLSLPVALFAIINEQQQRLFFVLIFDESFLIRSSSAEHFKCFEQLSCLLFQLDKLHNLTVY